MKKTTKATFDAASAADPKDKLLAEIESLKRTVEELRYLKESAQKSERSEEKGHAETRARLEEMREKMIKAKEDRNSIIDLAMWAVPILPTFTHLCMNYLKKLKET